MKFIEKISMMKYSKGRVSKIRFSNSRNRDNRECAGKGAIEIVEVVRLPGDSISAADSIDSNDRFEFVRTKSCANLSNRVRKENAAGFE